MAPKIPELMTRSEVAKLLDVTTEWVRKLELRGQLEALHTTGGKPLYLAKDIRRIKAERERAAKRG